MQTLNYIGETEKVKFKGSTVIPYTPWMQENLDPINLSAPEVNGLSTLRLMLKTSSGKIVHRNFIHVITTDGKDISGTQIISVNAKNYSDSEWTKKTWDVLEGKKVNGAGDGFFEYTINVGDEVNLSDSKEVYFIIEASAKELFVKDQEEYNSNQNFMRGSKVAPSSNPNSYPMTDEVKFPSTVKIFVNDKEHSEEILPDDPADHRGVLSWNAQPQDKKLREAGSYGYLIKISLNSEMLREIELQGFLKVKLKAVGGGLAIYGKDFGRYPLDPSLVIKY
jgi:hypothetical protein